MSRWRSTGPNLSGVAGLVDAIAQLVAAGVPMATGLEAALSNASAKSGTSRRRSFPAHAAPVRLPVLPARRAQVMDTAPVLPSVFSLPSELSLPPVSSLPTPEMPRFGQGSLAAVFATQAAHLRHAHDRLLGALGRQAVAHAAYVETSQRGFQAFLAASGGAPAPAGAAVLEPMPAAGPIATPAAPAAPRNRHFPDFARAARSARQRPHLRDLRAAFAAQDSYPRQVRMPMPPLLLADRVAACSARPASMRTGTIWTETDVRADSWYLHEGRMPTGILIESGQADLMLISWLGVDSTTAATASIACSAASDLPRPAAGNRRDAALRNLHRRPCAARRSGAVLLPLRLQVRRRPAPQRAPGPGRVLHRRRARRERRHPVDPSDDMPAPEAPLEGLVRAWSRVVERDAGGGVCRGRRDDRLRTGFLRCASHTRSPRIANGRLRLFDALTSSI